MGKQVLYVTVVVCSAILVGQPAADGQPVIFVDDDAPAGGDGTSWPSAYKHLQDALDFASVPANGVSEIRVAGGTYRPDRSTANPGGTGVRSETFQLIIGVVLRGGYAGLGAPTPDARDFALYETILSGDLNGDDGDNFANNGENSHHVVTGSGTDSTAKIGGFKISGGNAVGNPAIYAGGMFCSAGSPAVANCVFSRNRAGHGGGMANENNSSPTLVNCVFIGNSVTGHGGGMHNIDSNPTLTNCTFTGNVASNQPDGAMMNFNSTPVLNNCIMWGDLPGEMSNPASSPATMSYSCIQGGLPPGTIDGGGNIDADPMFVDPLGPDGIAGTEDDILRLSPGSPCIDAADNTAVPADTTDKDNDGDTTERTPLDLDLNPRFVDDPNTEPDTGVPAPDYPDVADMGAYEFQASVPIPTISEWGLIVMTFLMLTAGTLVSRRRQPSGT